MKYLLVCLSGITEIVCYLLYIYTIRKNEKYCFETNTESESEADKERSRTKKISRVQLLEACIYTAGICAIAVVVSENIKTYIDFGKLMIGYIGLTIAASIDYKIKRIPNMIVLGIMGARVGLIIFEYIFERENWLSLIGSSVLNAIIVFIVLFILSVISKSGLGMGDVKLLTALAFLCGMYAVLNTMIVALLICVLVAMILVISKKKKMRDKIPFGPFLLIGYIITMFLGAY